MHLVPFPPSPVSSRATASHAVALRAEADVEDEHTVFLKTIIPSRKAKKHYLGGEAEDGRGTDCRADLRAIQKRALAEEP